MKILSVYQAYSKDAEGNLPKCDYTSAGVSQRDIDLFEAAPDLLKLADEYLAFLWSEWHAHMSQAEFDSDQTVVNVRAVIAKARGVTR